MNAPNLLSVTGESAEGGEGIIVFSDNVAADFHAVKSHGTGDTGHQKGKPGI